MFKIRIVYVGLFSKIFLTKLKETPNTHDQPSSFYIVQQFYRAKRALMEMAEAPYSPDALLTMVSNQQSFTCYDAILLKRVA